MATPEETVVFEMDFYEMGMPMQMEGEFDQNGAGELLPTMDAESL